MKAVNCSRSMIAGTVKSSPASAPATVLLLPGSSAACKLSRARSGRVVTISNVTITLPATIPMMVTLRQVVRQRSVGQRKSCAPNGTEVGLRLALTCGLRRQRGRQHRPGSCVRRLRAREYRARCS